MWMGWVVLHPLVGSGEERIEKNRWLEIKPKEEITKHLYDDEYLLISIVVI